jgi:CRISPR-associated endonuclease/helicase Cas3
LAKLRGNEELRSSIPGFAKKSESLPLWLRMVYSCLVDADYLDTERFFKPQTAAQRQGGASLAALLDLLDKHLDDFPADPGTRVNQIRAEVLAACRAAAEHLPGIFSLTVPTGGGKTLSSMAFALKHAVRNDNRRIIYVIPYTSIIEQNAGVFREVFGQEEVLEHHSSLDPDETTERARLAAENWDAPIIVTTTVQFYESLFAASPGTCRKLHNIANSVVILDEAQLVPTEFLEPLLKTMQLLVEHYHVSFVICTATQPAFEKLKEFPAFPGLPEGSVREIIKDVDGLYKSLERVKIELPKDTIPVEWQNLAGELSGLDQVLCIVSDRKSCRELYSLMPKGSYHLSALMCAEHRSNVIAKIKEALLRRETVRVISTQLVEAGVDIDFPVVYRAAAGLDSIAQAAGRCNREGRLGKPGRVIVFNAPRNAPAGILRKAAGIARTLWSGGLENPIAAGVFRSYFSKLYWQANTLNKRNIISLLKPDPPHWGIQFREAAGLFRIIDDKDQRSILVPYKDGEQLIKLLEKNRVPERNLLRKLQRYTINIYSNQFSELQRRGSLKEVLPDLGIFALNNTVEYKEETGLLITEMPNDPEDFIA